MSKEIKEQVSFIDIPQIILDTAFKPPLLATYTMPSIRYKLGFKATTQKYCAEISQKLWSDKVKYLVFEEFDTLEEAEDCLKKAIQKNRLLLKGL